MPPKEISFLQNFRKRITIIAFGSMFGVLSLAALLLLWPLEPEEIENELLRWLAKEGQCWAMSVAFLVLLMSAVIVGTLPPMMLIYRSPVLTLTSKGIRLYLPGKILLRWEEIEALHEFLPVDLPWLIRHLQIGVSFRDEEAFRERVDRTVRASMDAHKKRKWPPLLIGLDANESVPEIMDEIEKYFDVLLEDEPERKLPKVYRRTEA